MCASPYALSRPAISSSFRHSEASLGEFISQIYQLKLSRRNTQSGQIYMRKCAGIKLASSPLPTQYMRKSHYGMIIIQIGAYYYQHRKKKFDKGHSLPHWNVFCSGVLLDRKHWKRPYCSPRVHRHKVFLLYVTSGVSLSSLAANRLWSNLQTKK